MAGQEMKFDEQKFSQIKEILNEAISSGKIDNWKLYSYEKKKSNVYLEKNYKIESKLKSSRKEHIITLSKYFDDEDKIGVSSFTFSDNISLDDFRKELADVIFISNQSKSKKYLLPEADDELVDDSQLEYGVFYNEKFFSDFEKEDLNLYVEDKLEMFKSMIVDFNLKNILKMKLNTLTFFNTIAENKVEFSSGINKGFKQFFSYMEFVLTVNDGAGKDTEYIVYEKINDAYNYDFEKFFSDSINYAKDTIIAKPSNDFSGKIILSDFACADFWNPDLTMNSVVGHTSARLKFLGISNCEVGKEVVKTNLDKLTIYSNPFLKNNNASSPFDGAGITNKRICLLKDNVFQNFFASKQYADYLSIKPTGSFGSVEVGPGKKSVSELYVSDEDMVEIISFASFVPDMVSGDFSAEIRLGYVLKSDGLKIPFRGGLFSGNIFDVLKDVEFSKEVVEKPGYFGPKVIKFHKGVIVGTE